MIRHIIWDVGGTLFDTYPAVARAFVAALGDFGKSAALDRVESLARQQLRLAASVLAAEHGIDEDVLDLHFERYYRETPPEHQLPFPGVIRVCEIIQAGGGLNVIVTHRGRESAVRLLWAHDMAGYFVDLIAKEDGYPRKPDPAALVAMIDRHGLDRAVTLAVGDRELDILAGRAAGVRTCLFGSERVAVAPDLAIRDYTELTTLIVAESGG